MLLLVLAALHERLVTSQIAPLVRSLVLTCVLAVVGLLAGVPLFATARPLSPLTAPKSAIGAQPAARGRLVQPAADVNIGNWTNAFPDLFAISAVSTTEIWAAGPYGQLLHYTNGIWTAVNPPNMRGAATWDVMMLSLTGGWIAAGDHAFRYDGTAWTEQSTGLGANLTISRLAGTALDDIWAIGGPADASDVVHWDGTSWRAVAPVVSATVDLTAINMLTAQDGWAVGYDQASPTAVVLHYDGTAWRLIPPPPGASALYSVGSAAPGDVWARGLDNTALPGGHFYHYSHGAWVADQPGGSFPAGPETLKMLGPADGWATTLGSVYHWDGTAWAADSGISNLLLMGLTAAAGQTWATGPDASIWRRGTDGVWHQEFGKPSHDELMDVATLSPDDAWAVGSSGAILHFTAGTWTPVPGPANVGLNALQMLSPTDGYAVGSAILHWDGLRWTQVATPTAGTALTAVAMSSSGNGWAVGSGAIMWRATGGVWRQVASPTGGDFHAVALDSPTHGWAAGSAYNPSGGEVPVLMEWDGTAWRDR
ncbi:MAG TPA: hypothetical protein VKY74_00240, partial [Chloroflexia bacterium]|nr:hypothetical protein [Chloroflexia bacterium]